MAGQSGWDLTHTGLDHRKSVGKPVKILMGATIGKHLTLEKANLKCQWEAYQPFLHPEHRKSVGGLLEKTKVEQGRPTR